MHAFGLKPKYVHRKRDFFPKATSFWRYLEDVFATFQPNLLTKIDVCQIHGAVGKLTEPQRGYP